MFKHKKNMKKFLHFSSIILGILSFSFSLSAQTPGPGSSYDYNSTFMSASNNVSLNPTSSMTIEAWIKADNWAALSWQNVIISKDGWAAGNEGFVLRAGGNGILSFNFSGAGVWREVVSAPIMTTGKWYHVAGTYDGTTIRIYINGEEVGTSAYTGSISHGAYDLNIGRASYTVGGPRYFDGQIDEVRMWNAAIPPSEIQDYMCQKIDPSHPSFASLVANYSFDNPGFLLDSSPNGNDLTNAAANQMTSGAPIGDQSVHQYGGIYDLSLKYLAIDSIRVQSTNAFSTIHLYRVDMAPNSLNATSTIDSMDYSHYYGVYTGSSTPLSYSLAYNYYGNPMGLANANYLNLAGRTNAAATQWVPQGATVDQPATKVNETFSDRTELMLAILCKDINLNISGIQDLCTGDSLIAGDLTENTNYQWHNSVGAITGETDSSYIITATDDYYLVANDGLCVDTSAIISVTINPIPTATVAIDLCSGESYTFADATVSNNITANESYTSIFSNAAANGCDSIVIENITITPLPDVMVSESGNTITAQNVNAGATYQWLDCDNSFAPLSGETNQTYTAAGNGSYAVAINEGDCADTSVCSIIDDVGIIENNFSNKVIVYPNPTKGDFSIDLGENYQTVTILVTDLNGKIVQSNTFNKSQLLNLKLEESSGVYLLNIESGNNKALIRLIKE